MLFYIRTVGLAPGCSNAGATWEEHDIYGTKTQAQVTPWARLTKSILHLPPKCVQDGEASFHPSLATGHLFPSTHTLIYNTISFRFCTSGLNVHSVFPSHPAGNAGAHSLTLSSFWNLTCPGRVAKTGASMEKWVPLFPSPSISFSPEPETQLYLPCGFVAKGPYHPSVFFSFF